MMVLLGGIIGSDIAPAPALATLPVSLQILGVALSTIPASFYMRRFGRRSGFVGASLIAALAALLAAYAVSARSFTLFCAATFLTGLNGAFVQQYRFAASESVAPERASRAVSLVLIGGIFAGILGPELAKRTKDLFGAGLYVGSFVCLAALYLVAAVFLLLLQNAEPDQQEALEAERPLRQITAQPIYLVALLSGAVGFGVMSFTMTATPIQMNKISGFSIDETAWVIQSHVIAMFLPSLFTGYIVDRLGVLRVTLIGALVLSACVGVALVSQHLLHYWGALVLLGLGWNFAYVGATVLLTQSYRPSERFKAQAANEFAIFSIQALASLSAGTIIFSLGWVALNLISLPFIVLMLGAVLLLRGVAPDRRGAAAPRAAGMQARLRRSWRPLASGAAVLSVGAASLALYTGQHPPAAAAVAMPRAIVNVRIELPAAIQPHTALSQPARQMELAAIRLYGDYDERSKIGPAPAGLACTLAGQARGGEWAYLACPAPTGYVWARVGDLKLTGPQRAALGGTPVLSRPELAFCADRASTWGKTHQCAESQAAADALADSAIGAIDAVANQQSAGR